MTKIDYLICQKIGWWGRAGGNLYISFGETLRKSQSGEDVRPFSLIFLSSWRLLDDKGIVVVAYKDIFCPPKKDTWTPDFDWDDWGSSAFDQISMDVMAGIIVNEEIRIVDVQIVGQNDLQILFSNGMKLESFADRADGENWRFIDRRPQYASHIIAYPEGLVLGDNADLEQED